MSASGVPVIELRLLTHRPDEMVRWWSAVLDALPQQIDSRTTAISGSSLRLVIERSQIALDFHPEASGVTAINFVFAEVSDGLRALKPVAHLGFAPLRAVRADGLVTIWVRDPNGTDVTVTVPEPTDDAGAGPQELDPAATLANLETRGPDTTHPLASER